MARPPSIRFAVIGVNHDHINEMTRLLADAGAELVSFYAAEDDLAHDFAAHFGQAVPRAASIDQILEDESIQLVASAAIPDERGQLGIAAMRHGKDFLSDKPAFTALDTLEEARQVQRETGRKFIVDFGERLRNRPMLKAAELVAAGAIGRVLQTVGLGPHKLRAHTRPAWHWSRARGGGILTDIGSHQADHFLFFTGSTSFEVVASQVGNLNNPEHSEFEDFGDAIVRGDRGSGYFRLDWFTPDGLPAFGDGRLTILGTDGFIEVRKNLDLDGRPGGYVLLADLRGTRAVDFSDVDPPFGPQLLADIRDRTETAMPQAHAFRAAELALRAELQAQRLPNPVSLLV